MPGDPFKKVQAGERLEIPAEAYNAFIDAARAVRQRNREAPNAPRDPQRADVAFVQNLTGTALSRFAVVQLGAPLVLPSDNLESFKSRVTFGATVPSVGPATDTGRIGIMIKPAAAGAISLAVVAGVAPVRLSVSGALYDAAEPVNGATGHLRNVPHGPIKVLWIESSAESMRWSIVRIDWTNYEEHVLITSNTRDSDGYYPGEVQRYDPVTKSWVSRYTCKVLDVND